MKTAFNIIVVFLFLQAVNPIGEEYLENEIGCQIKNDKEFFSGFSGSVYYYPWLSYNTKTNTGVQNTGLYTSKSYLSGGYVGDGSIIAQGHTVYTKPGVIANDVIANELYFRNDDPCDAKGCNGEVWLDLDYFANADGTAVSVPFKQFAFHMTGFMIPNITGQYIINLRYIDDLAIINIGSSSFKSPNCCDSYSPTGDVSGDNIIQSIWTYNGPSGVNELVLELVAGVAYPIEVFFVNRGGAGGMQLEYSDPNGDSHRNFEGFIYHLSSESVCSYVKKYVTTIEWDQSTTSYSSTSVSSIVTKTNSYLSDAAVTYTGTVVQETDIVYIPMSTVSTYWTGTFTTTTTSYSVSTGTDGNPTTKTVIVVETPESTITTPWTGTFTTTTTSYSVSTGTDGNPTTETVIVVETPSLSLRTTIPWTGHFTTSYTTKTVFVGVGNSSYTVPVIVVETPTNVGWNATSLKTASSENPSTAVTTEFNTEYQTVVCTEYSCLKPSQTANLPLSSKSIPSSVKTSYLSSSEKSLSNVFADTKTSTIRSIETSVIPSVEASPKSASTPSLITTENPNKANSLKISALFILLLHLV
ncbi:uncharacterized protein HGUI_01804 [Hanseniaspora guilliermondii]|uniref:PA14 domain-containing protein n=1 Tax=Hanseniaspora guilliermondii TaxID=56406 RepID=A0A1L0B1E4_9ASCO|nr:uncharacterized protein HGUI_01804 [Hanseniaspora guilliermondii]